MSSFILLYLKRRAKILCFLGLSVLLGYLALSSKVYQAPLGAVGLARSGSSAKRAPYASLPITTTIFNDDTWTRHAIKELRACEKAGNCGPHQRKAVLFASNWVNDGMFKNKTESPNVWAVNMVNGLRQAGYTVLLAEEKCHDAVSKWRQAPDNVVALLIKDGWKCAEELSFLKSKTNPFGLERWKIFDIAYYPSSPRWRDLDAQWSIQASANFDQPPTIIPLDVEDLCAQVDYVPHSRRSGIWVLADRAEYFQSFRDNFAWELSYFTRIIAEPFLRGMTLRGGWSSREVKDPNTGAQVLESDLPSVSNLGFLTGPALATEIAKAKALVGVGSPDLEVGPFLAMCLGTPFINPVNRYDQSNPDDKTRWKTNFPPLANMGPPFVYNARHGNYDDFSNSIRMAVRAPPKGSAAIPGHTKADRIAALIKLVETDWEAEARKVIKNKDVQVEWEF